MPNASLSPRLVFAAIFFVALLMVGVRLDSLFSLLTNPSRMTSVPVAQASSEKNAPKPAEKEKAHTPAPAATASTSTPAPPPSSAPAADTSMGGIDLVKHLASRRESLDKREQEMDAREALTKVAEQRIDQKLKEMETLRAQLQNMVNTLGASQQTQLDNLVKIYETMKPKEAARIFETLEMPVLMGVIQRMKPQRTALVMAEMDPLKAKEVTIALTKQDQLPKVK